jgi:hypothetical protein
MTRSLARSVRLRAVDGAAPIDGDGYCGMPPTLIRQSVGRRSSCYGRLAAMVLTMLSGSRGATASWPRDCQEFRAQRAVETSIRPWPL